MFADEIRLEDALIVEAESSCQAQGCGSIMSFLAVACVAFALRVAAAAEQCPIAECKERAPSLTPTGQSVRVYGPGLRGNFRLPARYFFVQVVDADGSK